MNNFVKILCSLAAIICVGCSAVSDEAYVPSIANLEANETLVMKLRACHNGCTKGTVKFKNNEATLGHYALVLTKEEINDLDDYFVQGETLTNAYFCSLPIRISFKHKRGMKTLKSKESQIYPCGFGTDFSVYPETLVRHFTETPNETPFWRLSEAEQQEHFIILDGN